MRVEDAVARGARGPVEVTGFLVGRVEGDLRLCSEVLESYPPQCGGPSVLVRGLDRATLQGLRSDRGGLWSDEEVNLTGTLEEGVLVVERQ